MDDFTHLIEEAIRQGIERFVVGAIIEIDKKILLLKRPEDDFMGGIYELPSGKVEEGEDIITALYREVEEETGIKVAKIKQYLGFFDYNSKSGKRTRQFNFLITPEQPFDLRLREHDGFAWVSKNELGRYNVTDSVRELIEPLAV